MNPKLTSERLSRKAIVYVRQSKPSDDAQEGRLSQLHGKPLPQRIIKHGVAGRVREISENNAVLVRKFRRAVEIGISGSSKYRNHQSSGDKHLPAQSQLPARTTYCARRCWQPCRFCVPL